MQYHGILYPLNVYFSTIIYFLIYLTTEYCVVLWNNFFSRDSNQIHSQLMFTIRNQHELRSSYEITVISIFCTNQPRSQIYCDLFLIFLAPTSLTYFFFRSFVSLFFFQMQSISFFNWGIFFRHSARIVNFNCYLFYEIFFVLHFKQFAHINLSAYFTHKTNKYEKMCLFKKKSLRNFIGHWFYITRSLSHIHHIFIVSIH